MKFENQKELAAWRRSVLEINELKFPDKRTLHQYNISDDAFETLRNLIKMEVLQTHDLVNLEHYFSAAFVIYAAEWWRRFYNGGRYKWEPIIESFGGKIEQWDNRVTKHHVIVGLNQWKLDLIEGGYTYLGTVAVQGGIPLSVFENESGKIADLLSKVVAIAQGKSVSSQVLEGWVFDLQTMLPKTYQQKSILKLLADLTMKAIEYGSFLKQYEGEDKIEILDRERPGWRKRLPVSINDKASRRFVDSFIKKVAKTEIKTRSKSARLLRRLKEDTEGNWDLYSEYHFAEELKIETLENLFSDFGEQHSKKETHPRTLSFELHSEDTFQSGVLHKLAGVKSYRFSKTYVWGFQGRSALREHLGKLLSKDGQVWQTALPHGETLDDDLPWFFEEDEEDGFRFVRQGSGTLSSKEVLLVIPMEWSINDDENKPYFDIPSLDRKAFIVVGNVQIQAGAKSFWLQTGHQGSDEESHYEWMGNREWIDSRPLMIFRGIPTLYRVKEDGGRHPVDSYKIKVSSRRVGPVILSFEDRNALIFRSRVIVIEKNAELIYKYESRTKGKIIFKGWGASKVEADVPVENSIDENGNLIATLSLVLGNNVPAFVTFRLSWQHIEKEATLRLPFPSVGAIGFDSDGREIKNRSNLSIQRLLGKRIHVFRKNSRDKVELELELSALGLKRAVTINATCNFDEIRLNDYRDEIERLLCASEKLDDEVCFRVLIDGKREYELKILPYDISLQFCENKERVFLKPDESLRIRKEDIEGIEALALRFQHLEDDPELIQMEVCGHEMRFSHLDAGSWLIYPTPESKVFFRPTLKVVKGDANAMTDLNRASNISREGDRHKQLDIVIDAMATDYLHEDWKTLETIYDKLGYLPLPVHDIWRRFVRSPNAMAALVFRLSTIPFRFVSRFTKGLPFAWEMIPVASWTTALKNLRKQCHIKFGESDGNGLFRVQADDRFKLLRESVPALQFLFGIVSSEFFEDEKQKLAGLKYIGQNAESELFEGKKSHLMKLRQSHRSRRPEDWPSFPEESEIDGERNAQITEFLFLENSIQAYQRDVVNLPLWLAVKVATNNMNDVFANPKSIHAWREFYDFDPEWFDEAFNLTIARCLADGVFDV